MGARVAVLVRPGETDFSPDERTQQAEQRAEQEQRLREDLIARLLERGIDPDAL
jgi:hypothetical protein